MAFTSKFLVVVRIRMELEVSSHFFFARVSFLLQLVSFTVDSDPLTDGECVNRTPSHRVFSRTCAHISSLFTCTAWLKVSHGVSSQQSAHPHVITCLIVRLSLRALTSSSLSKASTPSLISSSVLVIILHVVETTEY